MWGKYRSKSDYKNMYLTLNLHHSICCDIPAKHHYIRSIFFFKFFNSFYRSTSPYINHLNFMIDSSTSDVSKCQTMLCFCTKRRNKQLHLKNENERHNNCLNKCKILVYFMLLVIALWAGGLSN